MKTYRTILQTAIIILILAMNSISIGYGIRLESGWGIILGMASLGALAYCIHLFRRLNELESEEEYDNN